VLAVLAVLVVTLVAIKPSTVLGLVRVQAATKIGSTASVRWGDATPTVAQRVRVTGTVKPTHDVPRPVLLQKKTPSGWVEVSAVRSGTSGAYVLRLPTPEVGAATYRVAAPATEHARFTATRPRAVTVSRHSSSVDAELTATEVVVDKPVHVSGRVSPNPNGRDLVLQRRVPGGWHEQTTRRVTGAAYRMRVPTGWYGSFKYRVLAKPTDDATKQVSTVLRLRVKPSYDPQGSPSAWKFQSRARWEPCWPVRYRVNYAQAKDQEGALADVREAVRRVRQASGLRFEYLGSTSIIPQGKYHDDFQDAQIVIAWAKLSQSYALRAMDPAVGVGGHTNSAGLISEGFVVLNADTQWNSAGFATLDSRGAVLMHEIGHAIGLDHVSDPHQIMAGRERYEYLPARFGAGDLAGLSRVGANQGCGPRRRP